MPQLLIKTIKPILWLLPLIFTSYTSPGVKTADLPFVVGSYNLKTSGNQSMSLQGAVVFRTEVAFSSRGIPRSVIKLELENNANEKEHSMGFLICKQNRDEELEAGRYKVPVQIDGFIKDFEGVFGFANFRDMGEIPFFAANGTIDISYIGSKLLYGELEINLANSEGKQLKIKGEFTATRKQIK